MKFALSLYSLLDISPAEVIETAVYAEDHNLDYVVLGESAYRDVFLLLMLIAQSTRKIKLGTNIIPIFTRTPTQIAMSVNTLNEVANGRFDLLGLGRGGPMILEPNHGIKVEKTQKRMKEYIQILNQILAGKKVVYNGEFFKIDNTWIAQTHGIGATTSQIAHSKVSIYVGCQGPRMLRTAARYADGIIFSTMSTPEYLKWAIEEIQNAAKDAGRDFEKIDLGLQILAAANDNPENVREAVQRAMLYYLRGDQEKFNMEKAGLADKHQEIRETYLKGNVKDALRLIDDTLIDRLSFMGTADDIKKKVLDYNKLGISLFTIRSVVDDATGTKTVKDNIDAFASMVRNGFGH
jgi:5,10-methylenetetrahydromethanopterin reductase